MTEDFVDEISGEPIFRVLMPAGMIPLNSIVTKRTGVHEYTLTDVIKVYGENGLEQTIKSDGVRYLVDGHGVSINAVTNDKILCWVVSEEELLRFLQLRVEVRYSK
jgi:hypothetical protein